ncbi:hypothetical protein PSECIP111951_00923 [Pseudoalteromonas holothuriae]|uniref:Transposase n=1 Tax=Pseudoalteromonas holothuriae TaxID=2963714 RepID=A0ABN8UI09_9GAMM|nr:hypothetical protein PSECIP111951_00923 [Pseudoalteromonas sp. CIP111951]
MLLGQTLFCLFSSFSLYKLHVLSNPPICLENNDKTNKIRVCGGYSMLRQKFRLEPKTITLTLRVEQILNFYRMIKKTFKDE